MENIEIALENVAREIEHLRVKRQAHLRATHGRFNLFTVLLQENDEVRLHSRYLAHLLDPDGTHDCDRLFLDSFLETVGLAHKEEFRKCCFAVNEHCTNGFGNIDIYIEFEKAIVVIENKIGAADQNHQIGGYYKYAEQKGKPVYLFYLTLDGCNPSDGSAGKLKRAKEASELGDHNYYCISYEGHILNWLEKCCQLTKSFGNINQALQQYINVVNQLLGNTLEAQDMDKIKNMIKKNPAIMSQIDQIEEAIKSIKQDRNEKVQCQCLRILGRRAYTIEDWDVGTAFMFCDQSWGQGFGYTGLTLIMASNENYKLKAYDVKDGKLMRVINDPFGWEPEKDYFGKNFFENKNLDTALIALKQVMDKLK